MTLWITNLSISKIWCIFQFWINFNLFLQYFALVVREQSPWIDMSYKKEWSALRLLSRKSKRMWDNWAITKCQRLTEGKHRKIEKSLIADLTLYSLCYLSFSTTVWANSAGKTANIREEWYNLLIRICLRTIQPASNSFLSFLLLNLLRTLNGRRNLISSISIH